MKTWQWIKAPSAVGQSDWHRQNKDRAMCLISCARTAHQQLWGLQQCNELSHILNVRRITTRELVCMLGIAKVSVDKIIHQSGFSNVCARWVPLSLTGGRKEQRQIICSELLARCEAEGDDFLSTIVRGDETWIHHFEPESKRQSMEWHHTTSPR
jgi:hypothetical protein